MSIADYHIFGIGVGAEDLRYIGWTQSSIDQDKERILSDLMEGAHPGVTPVVKALHGGTVSIFEIESVSSMDDARSSVAFWRTYYRALGLEVLVDH
jgi:hypothetical protein